MKQTISNFVTRKQSIINYNLNANYDVGSEITYYKEVLKSNLSDYNHAYTLVRGNIAVIAGAETKVSFKNCASFAKCITNVDGTTTDDAADLDLVMPV